MSRLPAVLCRIDLPEAELHAAKLDGEVYLIDQCFSPIDEINQRKHRAKSLLLAVSDRLIAERQTAAWVHGALVLPPRQHQFCADISARTRPAGLIAITMREVVIDSSELADIAGLLVTTPLRTVVDLARTSIEFDDKDFLALINLMRIGHFGLDECQDVLGHRRNLPNKRLALERIDEAVRRAGLAAGNPIDVVDRINATNRIENSIEMGGISHLENEPAQRESVACGGN